jgi:hypothetical protein
MQVHDLAKNEWLLFTKRKWVESTHFRKIYFFVCNLLRSEVL